MQQLVDILEDYLKRHFNEDTLKVFRQLWGKSNVSEFDIAEHLRLSINYVRNLLYGLHAYNLVNSTRKKDRQKGWYIYYWTFNVKHAIRLILQEKQQLLVGLEKSRGEGSRERYVCPEKHVVFNAVRALEHGFKCPECEKVLVRQMTLVHPAELQARQEGLQKEIEFLEQPLVLREEKQLKKPHVAKKKPVKKKILKKVKKIKRKIRKLQKKLTKTKKPASKKKILRKIRKLKVRKKILKKPFSFAKEKPLGKEKSFFRKKVRKKTGNPLGKGKEGRKPHLPRSKPAVKKPVAGSQKAGLLSTLRKRVGF